MTLNRAYQKTAEFLARQLQLNFQKGKAAPAILARHMVRAAAQLIDRTHNRKRKGRPATYAARQAAQALFSFFGYTEGRAMAQAFRLEIEALAGKAQRHLI